MTRSWGGALWGYHKKATDLYIARLQAQVAERQQEREAVLTQLKENIRVQAEAVDQNESMLKSLQAEYFHLSGELTSLTLRSQQTLENAESEWRRQEDLMQADVQTRRQYVESLADTIRAVPDEIRGLIERIAAPMTRPIATNPSSDESHRMIASDPGADRGSSLHPSESSEQSSG